MNGLPKPVDEHVSVEMVCETGEGNPAPNVLWTSDDDTNLQYIHVISNHYPGIDYNGWKTRSTASLTTRRWMNKFEYTCFVNMTEVSASSGQLAILCEFWWDIILLNVIFVLQALLFHSFCVFVAFNVFTTFCNNTLTTMVTLHYQWLSTYLCQFLIHLFCFCNF